MFGSTFSSPQHRHSTAAPEMVGLSVILDQVCESTRIISTKPSRSPPNFNLSSAAGFLEICFLCKHKLLPGKDIYMYKGDKAFCSVECRYKQIFMDEQETSGCTLEYNCSVPASSSGGGGRRRNAFAY